MVRGIHKLTALEVSKATEKGLYGDGGGLYLQVKGNGKSWLFRYMRDGKAREMGLGPVNTVSLADARLKALDCRKQLLEGVDPIEARNAKEAHRKAEQAKQLSFDECARKYIEAHSAGWRNAKHADQWRNTLATYASPTFGALPVSAVDTALVVKALEAIWTAKPETATRVRGRIESVLDWATVRGYRSGDNPARWRGHLDKLLAKRSKIRKVEHHPALPYDAIGEFVAEVRTQEGASPRALEFLILTATRTAEVTGAKPEEFDLNAGLWVIPGSRMKAGKEHRVPLSPRAVEIVRDALKLGGEHVFPGQKKGKPLSNMAMLVLLKRMNKKGLTVHGFRSTFRDWAAERTNFPREVAEAALAHTLSDKVEAAYRRGDLFAKRARLMAEWAKHCENQAQPGQVLPLLAAGAV